MYFMSSALRALLSNSGKRRAWLSSRCHGSCLLTGKALTAFPFQEDLKRWQWSRMLPAPQGLSRLTSCAWRDLVLIQQH